MRIVQLANMYGPRTGGLKTALDQLAHHYTDAGHEVLTIVPGETTRVEHHGLRQVQSVAAPLVPRWGGYRMIVRLGEVKRAIAEFCPDVIELSDKATLVDATRPARHAGVPVVMISHERLDHVIDAVTPVSIVPIVTAYNRRLARHADRMVFASRYAAAEFDGYDLPPTHHIPLGVDLQRFTPSASDRPRDVRIITTSRLHPEKRPDVVAPLSRELVRRGVEHEVRVYGHGPMQAQLKRDAAGLPIRHMGYVSDRQLLAHEMASADMVVAPGPIETFGLAALEAMACGTPIITPNCGALPELLTAGGCTGYSVPLEPGPMADAAMALRAGDRHAQRRATRRRAEEFTWAATAAAMLHVFDEVCPASAVQRRAA